MQMPTKKIALEEAFTAPGMDKYVAVTLADVKPGPAAQLKANLADFDRRIEVMDAAGIDIFVLSETSPGVQIETDSALAVERARSSNDFLQSQIERYPERYRGFAHLPMQDVKAAGDELERCVKDLGFLGGLINGQTNGVYLDDARFLPFWERVTTLGVPIYIHPHDPHVQPVVFDGYPEMRAALWGWNVETSSHFLRLVFSGLFDRYPELTVILGHMGETLPFYPWRIDARYQPYIGQTRVAIKKKPSDYFRQNLMITTTGVCSDAALQCALSELGEDRVMFSVDYPYEDSKTAADWIEAAPLDTATRELVCYKNAERVLKI
jgi:2,3-dihydroxybenzoate decarboxylase